MTVAIGNRSRPLLVYEPVDAMTSDGTGKARVRDSGLWNQNHVDEDYDAGFLGHLEKLVNDTKAPA